MSGLAQTPNGWFPDNSVREFAFLAKQVGQACSEEREKHWPYPLDISPKASVEKE
jgi:hypothetical protein